MAATLVSGMQHIASFGSMFRHACIAVFGARASETVAMRRGDRFGPILSYGPPTDLHM